MGSYLLCCFDAYNVDAVVHEIDQFWVLQMMASIVEDIEAISVTVFIFISPATANIKVGTVVDFFFFAKIINFNYFPIRYIIL